MHGKLLRLLRGYNQWPDEQVLGLLSAD
ncbi:uncharacterized protein METZ01_LOCUS402139 [marine metagenome]|uniref:Uncharacterized protein n=1 Tax=marine metagenome TaxID=408172 RepID=A0A382VTB8_9ZZZZ